MSVAPLELATIGAIGQRLGEPLHRVEYVVRSRGIEPFARAGNARVFSEAQVERIASELRRMDEGREGVE